MTSPGPFRALSGENEPHPEAPKKKGASWPSCLRPSRRQRRQVYSAFRTPSADFRIPRWFCEMANLEGHGGKPRVGLIIFLFRRRTAGPIPLPDSRVADDLRLRPVCHAGVTPLKSGRLFKIQRPANRSVCPLMGPLLIKTRPRKLNCCTN